MPDKASDSGERRKVGEPITIDRALQTVGGLLLIVSTALCGWAWTRIEAHEGRIIRIETQVDGIGASLKEIKDDLKEIKTRLEKGKP